MTLSSNGTAYSVQCLSLTTTGDSIMPVRYDRGSVGRIKALGLRPVTIDLGGGLTWQGGVTQQRQQQLLQLMQQMESEYQTLQQSDDGKHKLAKYDERLQAQRDKGSGPAPSANGTATAPAAPPPQLAPKPKQPASGR